jgi:hypothetical protein
MWDAFQRSGNPKTTFNKQNMWILAWDDSLLDINLLIFSMSCLIDSPGWLDH